MTTSIRCPRCSAPLPVARVLRACLSCGAEVDLQAQLRAAQKKLPLVKQWEQAEWLAGEVQEPSQLESSALRSSARDRALFIPIVIGSLSALLALGMVFSRRRLNNIAKDLWDAGVNPLVVIVPLIIVAGGAFVYAAIRAHRRELHVDGPVEQRLGVVEAIDVRSTPVGLSSRSGPFREHVEPAERIETHVVTLRARDGYKTRLEGINGVTEDVAAGDFVVAFTRGTDLIALRRLPVGRPARA